MTVEARTIGIAARFRHVEILKARDCFTSLRNWTELFMFIIALPLLILLLVPPSHGKSCQGTDLEPGSDVRVGSLLKKKCDQVRTEISVLVQP